MASCQEVSNILSSTGAKKEEKMCTDAQAQLGGECCYEQCALCGGDDESALSTEWYATVSFQGLTTTCLGLDYMLRIEQISDGSDGCGTFQGQYAERCCYRSADEAVSAASSTEASPSDSSSSASCQLCMADNILYDVDPSKVVVIDQSSQRSTTAECTTVSDTLAKFEISDRECTEGKPAFFGQCCDLSSGILSDVGTVDTLSVVTPGGEYPRGEGVASQTQPQLYLGGRPNVPPSPSDGGESGGAPPPSSSSGEPTSSLYPTSEGGHSMTIKPTTPYYWGNQQTEIGDFSWDRNWDPPSGGVADLSPSRGTFWLSLFGLPLLFLFA